MTTPVNTPATVTTPGTTPALKPGFKTTEFAIVVLTDVGILAAALAGNLSPKYAALATAVSNGAYAVARGLAKAFPPKPSN